MTDQMNDGELISTEEYKRRLNSFQQYNPEAVRMFRSTGRAARRGRLLKSGMIVPKRPYNNRGNTCKRKGAHSRTDNELKKEMWQLIKETVKDGQY